MAEVWADVAQGANGPQEWEVVFFEDGDWHTIDSYDTKEEAEEQYNICINHLREGQTEDYIAIVGPGDVMPPDPTFQ